jgi:hypothetical protein
MTAQPSARTTILCHLDTRSIHPRFREPTLGNLNTFNGMSAQGAQVHMANTHVTEPPMDSSNPFAPLGQNFVGYNVMRDDNSSSNNTSYKNPRWNSRLQVRNNGKGKGKGKPFKKGKTRDPNHPYWTIPDFGKASGDARVVLFTMAQFSESTNPYRMKIPKLLERSNSPGYVVHLPSPEFIAARKRQGQATDQGVGVAYHNALKALYQLNDSPRLYYLHDEMKQARTLLGQAMQYLNGEAVQELVPKNQKLSLGDYWRVLRVRLATNRYKTEQLQLEYIPNNTYGYYEVKTTLDNVIRLKIKPTRYWNELLVKDVQVTFYTL